ncbi:platelet glycoprotein Ib beta chain [Dromiciops gliroides]|uniref:platelet glycoprotein Ib beta chain n=1 Tax=Dromiciops gliroides TaxID=33562 RepID=UPI001CC7BA8D|nr:platelet glycoprotein Ib beta chain [Dromiciops gliroides]
MGFGLLLGARALGLLLLASVPQASVPQPPVCPVPCRCAGGLVDCGHQHLTVASLPKAFPLSTTEINLQANNLSSVPAGLFDGLPSLHLVHLAANPWQCDCGLLYLWAWLGGQQDRRPYRDLRCSGPRHLQGRLLLYLGPEELQASCRLAGCSQALGVQLALLCLLLLHLLLLLVLLLRLWRYRALARETQLTAQDLLQTMPLVLQTP